MHEFAQDITVSLDEDRPGALAGIFEIISRADINIEGYAVIEGLLHFLTKDGAAARDRLQQAGVRVRRQRDVFVVYVPNRVGGAAEVFRRIADAGINVHFSYVVADNRLVIGADSIAALAELRLGGSG